MVFTAKKKYGIMITIIMVYMEFIINNAKKIHLK